TNFVWFLGRREGGAWCSKRDRDSRNSGITPTFEGDGCWRAFQGNDYVIKKGPAGLEVLVLDPRSSAASSQRACLNRPSRGRDGCGQRYALGRDRSEADAYV